MFISFALLVLKCVDPEHVIKIFADIKIKYFLCGAIVQQIIALIIN